VDTRSVRTCPAAASRPPEVSATLRPTHGIGYPRRRPCGYSPGPASRGPGHVWSRPGHLVPTCLDCRGSRGSRGTRSQRTQVTPARPWPLCWPAAHCWCRWCRPRSRGNAVRRLEWRPRRLRSARWTASASDLPQPPLLVLALMAGREAAPSSTRRASANWAWILGQDTRTRSLYGLSGPFLTRVLAGRTAPAPPLIPGLGSLRRKGSDGHSRSSSRRHCSPQSPGLTRTGLGSSRAPAMQTLAGPRLDRSPPKVNVCGLGSSGRRAVRLPRQNGVPADSGRLIRTLWFSTVPSIRQRHAAVAGR